MISWKQKSPANHILLFEELIFHITSKEECGTCNSMTQNWQELVKSNILGMKHDMRAEETSSFSILLLKLCNAKIQDFDLAYLDWNSSSATC